MRAFVPVALLLAGCTDPVSGPVVESQVEQFEIPLLSTVRGDLLIVISNAPGMAIYRDRILAAAPVWLQTFETTARRAENIHVGATTSDLAGGGVLRRTAAAPDGYLAHVDLDDHTHEATYADRTALAELVDAGSTGAGVDSPLEVIRLALDPARNPGFRRLDAFLGVLIIADRDDQSLGAVEDYAAELAQQAAYAGDVLVFGVYPRPAPRLDAMLGAFADGRPLYTSLPDGDLDTALWPLGSWIIDYLLPCIAPPTGECSMSWRAGAGPEHAMPPCPSDEPCYELAYDPASCGGDDLLLQHHFGHREVPPATVVSGQCVVGEVR